jgi:signal transduction histidine kinase
MKRLSQPIRTGSSVDLAFAVVVLAAYFTTFSAVKSISVSGLIVLIFLGIAYMAMGVYGYAYCAQSGSFLYQMGYFVVQIFLGDLIFYLGGATGFNAMLLLPLAGHSVVLLPEFWRYAVNGALVATYAVAVRVMTGGWSAVWTNLPVFLAGQIFILVFTQMAVSEERARKEIQELAEELEKANRQLREYSVQVEELAIARERNRLAREIHDGLGHHLTAINMQIRAARAVIAQNSVREKSENLLKNAEDLTLKALVDVRQSVSALMGSSFENILLPEKVEDILRDCKTAGLATNLRVLGEPRVLSPQATLAVYRSVQESIHNTIKHASASQVDVTLDYQNQGQFKLDIVDDGIGSDDPDGGFGLLSMRERVQLLEGDIIIKTAKGRGFEVDIQIPE